MLFRKEELKHLWPFYLGVFISGLSVMIHPFIVFYYLSIGLSYFQISVIISVHAISMALFEIPTGALADGFSRKYSVIIGLFIVAFSVFLVPLTSDFYVLVFLWTLVGVGMTFLSGAQEAWVIDNLNRLERSDLSQEYFLKSGSIAAFGAVFAPTIGAILVKSYSIKILWFVLAFGYFLSSIVLFFFTSENFKPEKLKFKKLMSKTLDYSKLAFVFSFRNKTFFYAMLAGIFMELMFIGGIGMTPFLKSLGMNEFQLGYFSSILAIVAMTAPFLSRLFVKSHPKNIMSLIVLVVMVLQLLLLGILPPFFVLVCVIQVVVSGLTVMGSPIFETYLHKNIPGRIRATTISVKSMICQFIVAVFSLIVGFSLDKFGPQKVLAYGALIGIASIFFFRKIDD